MTVTLGGGIMQTYLGAPSIQYGKGFDSVGYYTKVAIL